MADEPFGFISDSRMRQLLADMQLLKSIVLGSQNTQQPQIGTAPIYVTNVSGEEIPAYACMQCTGTETIGNRTYVQVDQPADSDGAAGGFLFNSPRAIPIDGNGVAFAGPHVKALGDGSTATAGGRWAPQASNWAVGDDVDGIFMCIGNDDVATNIVRLFCHQAPTVTQTYVTDIRVNGTTLQYKTRDAFIFPASDETNWTTWHTGEDCTT